MESLPTVLINRPIDSTNPATILLQPTTHATALNRSFVFNLAGKRSVSAYRACFRSFLADRASIRREKPLNSMLTPISVPMAQTEL